MTNKNFAMKTKFVALLLVSLVGTLSAVRGQQSEWNSPNVRTVGVDKVVYDKNYPAAFSFYLTAIPDEGGKNYTKFRFAAICSYNPGPGTDHREYTLGEDIVRTVPVNGKTHFKVSGVDERDYQRKEGVGEFLLKRDGKLMAFDFDVKFDGKQKTAEKALVVKVKMMPVDKNEAEKYK